MPAPEDDDNEPVPIPLDRMTRARLVAFARAVGDHPVACAAALLRSLLEDDEQAERRPN